MTLLLLLLFLLPSSASPPSLLSSHASFNQIASQPSLKPFNSYILSRFYPTPHKTASFHRRAEGGVFRIEGEERRG